MISRVLSLSTLVLFSSAVFATQAPATPKWDPFKQQLRSEDVQRFAKLFAEAKGAPTAAQLTQAYLQPGSRGIEIFTPHRIVNAENLAKNVAERKDDYAWAIQTCLPLLDGLNAEMRSVYLAFHGLLPDVALPDVYVVFGSGNSGGTAAADAQVLGLEVACKKGTSAQEFKTYMRMMFAHETVHSLQQHQNADWASDPMLMSAISEGTADYLASVVLGRVPDPERDVWAKARGAELWQQFAHDRATVRSNVAQAQTKNTPENKAFLRWFANAGAAPEGWPFEAGYWIGRQIVTQYVERAPDKMAAIQRLLSMKDAEGILRDSGIQLDSAK